MVRYLQLNNSGANSTDKSGNSELMHYRHFNAVCVTMMCRLDEMLRSFSSNLSVVIGWTKCPKSDIQNSLSTLLTALDDGDSNVRGWSAQAIGGIGPDAV